MKFQSEAHQFSFAKIEMSILQFIWKCKDPYIAKKISRKRVGELTHRHQAFFKKSKNEGYSIGGRRENLTNGTK